LNPQEDSLSIRERLLNRRTLIQASGATAIAAVASADRFMARPHFVSAQSIATIAADLNQTGTDFNRGDLPAQGGYSSASADEGLVVQRGLNGVKFLSNVISVDFPMTHVGPNWQATYNGGWFTVEVRLSQDGKKWTQWMPVSIEAFQGEAQRPGVFGYLLNGYRATKMQYRLTFDTRGGPVSIQRMTLTALNSEDGAISQVMVPESGSEASAAKYIAKPRVITRAGWGCDESLRFRGGEEIWGKEYVRWRAVVPHHTATTNDYWDPAPQVRSIYYYHAVTQGWGDIGYHALIGNNKEVYEGRKSRDGKTLEYDLMAGHVLQCNAGSFGFAFIGDFSYYYIPSGMLRAAQKVAAWVCAERDINPIGTISFERSDRSVYNGAAIAAHRNMQRPDLYPTACPGDTGYTQFPWFRSYVKAKLDAAPDKDTTPTPPPSTKRYVFSSSGRSAGTNESTLAWDNHTSTYWQTTTKNMKSARIQFDLGSSKYCSRVRWLLQKEGWSDWCTIERSTDKKTWTFVADSSELHAKVWYERLIGTKLRYLRFSFTNVNNDTYMGGLAEVQLYP
jgi:hypothetical protein